MRGLLRNNFYSMASNIRLSLIMAGFLSLVPLVLKESAAIPMILSIQIFLFVVNTGTSLRVDETSKWNKFELTLPIRRRTIIGAKYVSFTLLILLGVMMSLLTLGFVYVAGFELDPKIVIYSYGFGLTLSITLVSLMYPIMLKIGTEKNELVVFFSGFAAIGMMLVLAALLAPVTGGMQLRHPLVGMISSCMATILFVISYFVSVHIHRNKEFK
ncbi:ABC-2 transporter permease [Paenibacillus algorifonticola]|uniref:ABC-2 transporter permease n=1 Tax=Paenibacillus algorifonticola TaxID=684063 RepID=UPI003D2A0BC9